MVQSQHPRPLDENSERKLEQTAAWPVTALNFSSAILSESLGEAERSRQARKTKSGNGISCF
jgi:hypothetical protein